MAEISVYHNPRCSKSRAVLELLNQRNISAEIILYLENPPSPDDICHLLKKLDMPVHNLIRKGEPLYKELKLDKGSWSDKALIVTLSAYPKLIERPILVKGDKAVIGRPPEAVLAVL